MESIGYEKSGKITLVGFVIFSLIVIWLVNVYFIGERDYLQRETDMQMSKEILLDSQKTDQVLINMHQNLLVQKEWLKKIIRSKSNNENYFLSQTVYLEDKDVTIINEAQITDATEVGNVIIYGKQSEYNAQLMNELNQLDDYFKLEKVLYSNIDFPMNSIYYSKNKYVTYYPYVEIGKRDVDYNQIFSNVDGLIEKIQKLDLEDENFDPEEGWDRASIDDSTSKKLTLSTAMPVVVDGEISGILTGTIDGAVLHEIFKKDKSAADIYVTDASNSIIFTSNKDYEVLTNISDVFLQQYKVKYFQNKFPTPIEIRREKEYTLYITKLSKENWYVIYVVDKKNVMAGTRIVLLNLMMIIMVIGIVYYSLRYSNLKKDKLESIIKNSKHDSMTELLNHKNIMEALKKFVKYRRIRQLAVMMLDLDDFKKVNDTFGHAIGDDVIRTCATTIKSILDNKNALCGRYGGEEFMIIASRISEQDAVELAERIRVSINEAIYEKMGINVTISIGVYHIVKPIDLSTIELVNKADKNLYIAKNAGKNQVQNG
ncbi:MAG: hypothetical protein CVU84_11260 [Firmicutes bacterium HGW-Firmicutes-1]|jgi:diguanylate cyclase (GGDEF)-like protein|nr:MAG: hypothetical protein CVU84_11260 [Firmicutes bacterium HGW-Firmicutes-1]